MNLSVVILTRNEEKNIEGAISSVHFAPEIIIVDNESTDKTVEVVKKLKAKVYERKLEGDFASQRNFGLEKAEGKWVLFLDADERVSGELAQDIKRVLNVDNGAVGAYYVRRRDWFWGRELRFGEISTARKKGFIRLVRKDAGHFEGAVHEEFKTKNKTATLSGYIDHFSHQTLKEFITDINFYSTLRASQLRLKGKKFSLTELIFFPPVKFFYTYFVRGGFLDGPAGFAYSFLMSFHSFLVRAKLYKS